MLERFNTTTRLIIAVSLAVVIWIAGVLVGQEQTVTILNPQGGLNQIINRQVNIKVSLMLDFGEGKIIVYPETQVKYGQTVLNLLQKISQEDKSGLKLVYDLDAKTGELKKFSLQGISGNLTGRQWLVWLNNQLQTQPINSIKLKSKDIIELKYVKLISNP
ncbi:MAG: hypothetical protein WCV73_01875 [Patescibacteria group bacterium]|jgi:hypothetical protein